MSIEISEKILTKGYSNNKEEGLKGIEFIQENDIVLAIIIASTCSPETTSFITPETYNQQGGFVVYPQGGEIRAHDHRPIIRKIEGTSETLLVRKGKLIAYIYNAKRELVAERILRAGDILMLINGGHGFKMLEDSVLFEIKQGPYTGLVEKERF